jgi:PKD repeat protein
MTRIHGREADMTRTGVRLAGVALGVAALLSVAGCTTKDTKAPDLAGPSELGVSVAVTATPDVLVKDGSAQSTVVITARNANNQPVSGLGLRIETLVGNTLVDIGRLSAKAPTTGSDGQARVTYTAPLGNPDDSDQSDETIVTIRVTPVGNDFAGALPRQALVRLIPSGAILPPAGTPRADFAFAPATPAEGQAVQFDASASRDVLFCPEGATSLDQCVTSPTLASYAWTFGDGATGTGRVVSHAYTKAGTYTVTLSVANDRGRTASVSKFVAVQASANPTAAFTFSPSTPEVLQSVFFNASASRATTGRTIVGYEWTFGDGGSGSGVTTTHRFGTLGAYTVTLTVTDDIGKTGTASQTVSLGADQVPTADFVYSPTDGAAPATVNFDASVSTPPPGRSLVGWSWNFGDGGSGAGQRVSHLYAAAGSYVVTLTVTDSSGATKTTTKTVAIR